MWGYLRVAPLFPMQEIVISVPHSGTRTLMEGLGLNQYEHFNRTINLPVRAHIPIRHPLDVAASWASRDKRGGADRLLRMYSNMLDYIKNHVVISVPHSGTRTLMEHTGIRANEQGFKGAGDWWHFGSDRFRSLIATKKHQAHIPIRHPLDVARSWASRDKTGNVLASMLTRYREMFEYLESHDAILYRMEDLPRTKGTGEHKEGDHSERIQQFQDAVMAEVIEPNRSFFGQYYEDLR